MESTTNQIIQEKEEKNLSDDIIVDKNKDICNDQKKAKESFIESEKEKSDFDKDKSVNFIGDDDNRQMVQKKKYEETSDTSALMKLAEIACNTTSSADESQDELGEKRQDSQTNFEKDKDYLSEKKQKETDTLIGISTNIPSDIDSESVSKNLKDISDKYETNSGLGVEIQCQSEKSKISKGSDDISMQHLDKIEKLEEPLLSENTNISTISSDEISKVSLEGDTFCDDSLQTTNPVEPEISAVTSSERILSISHTQETSSKTGSQFSKNTAESTTPLQSQERSMQEAIDSVKNYESSSEKSTETLKTVFVSDKKENESDKILNEPFSNNKVHTDHVDIISEDASLEKTFKQTSPILHNLLIKGEALNKHHKNDHEKEEVEKEGEITKNDNQSSSKRAENSDNVSNKFDELEPNKNTETFPSDKDSFSMQKDLENDSMKGSDIKISNNNSNENSLQDDSNKIEQVLIIPSEKVTPEVTVESLQKELDTNLVKYGSNLVRKQGLLTENIPEKENDDKCTELLSAENETLDSALPLNAEKCSDDILAEENADENSVQTKSSELNQKTNNSAQEVEYYHSKIESLENTVDCSKTSTIEKSEDRLPLIQKNQIDEGKKLPEMTKKTSNVDQETYNNNKNTCSDIDIEIKQTESICNKDDSNLQAENEIIEQNILKNEKQNLNPEKKIADERLIQNENAVSSQIENNKDEKLNNLCMEGTELTANDGDVSSSLNRDISMHYVNTTQVDLENPSAKAVDSSMNIEPSKVTMGKDHISEVQSDSEKETAVKINERETSDQEVCISTLNKDSDQTTTTTESECKTNLNKAHSQKPAHEDLSLEDENTNLIANKTDYNLNETSDRIEHTENNEKTLDKKSIQREEPCINISPKSFEEEKEPDSSNSTFNSQKESPQTEISKDISQDSVKDGQTLSVQDGDTSSKNDYMNKTNSTQHNLEKSVDATRTDFSDSSKETDKESSDSNAEKKLASEKSTEEKESVAHTASPRATGKIYVRNDLTADCNSENSCSFPSEGFEKEKEDHARESRKKRPLSNSPENLPVPKRSKLARGESDESDDEDKLVIDEGENLTLSSKGKLKKTTKGELDRKTKIALSSEENETSLSPSPTKGLSSENDREESLSSLLNSKESVCDKCKEIWNDYTLKMLFEGNESVTINSRITYGAIICMNVYVGVHYPNFREKALRGLLDRADLAKNLGPIKVSILNSWLVALIKNQKINCCHPFRPIYRVKSALKRSNKDGTKSDDKIPSKQNDSSQPKSQEVNADKTSSSTDSSNKMVKSSKKQQNLVPEITIEEEESDNAAESHSCGNKGTASDVSSDWSRDADISKESFGTGNKLAATNGNIYYQLTAKSKQNPNLHSIVSKERENLESRLHPMYDKLVCESKLTEAEIKCGKRKCITNKEVLNIHSVCILNCKGVNLQNYYKLFLQILHHREYTIFIPDGKELVQHVENLRREDNRHKWSANKTKQFRQSPWDADGLYSSPILEKAEKQCDGYPTIREILSVFCSWKNKDLFNKPIEMDLSTEISSLFKDDVIINDCLGLCVKLYSRYCHLMFDQRESDLTKVKLFLNLCYLPKTNQELLQNSNSNITFDCSSSFFLQNEKELSSTISYLEEQIREDAHQKAKRALPEAIVDCKLDQTKKLKTDLIGNLESEKMKTLMNAYSRMKNEMNFFEKQKTLTTETADPTLALFAQQTASYTQELKLMIAKLRAGNVPIEFIPPIIEKIFKNILKKKVPSVRSSSPY